MDKIYVVMGTTGEYSDRTEWPVYAFTDEGQARAFVEKVSKLADVVYVECEDKGSFWNCDEFESVKEVQKYDKEFMIEYTGTSYFIYEVEMWEGDDD